MDARMAQAKGLEIRRENNDFRERLREHPLFRRRDIIVHGHPDKKGKQLLTVLMAGVEYRSLILIANSVYENLKDLTDCAYDANVVVHEDDREQGQIVAERCAMLRKATREVELEHG